MLQALAGEFKSEFIDDLKFSSQYSLTTKLLKQLKVIREEYIYSQVLFLMINTLIYVEYVNLCKCQNKKNGCISKQAPEKYCIKLAMDLNQYSGSEKV